MTVYDYLKGLFTTTAALIAGQVPGTSTNDSATAGNVGELIQSIVSTPANVPTTSQYGDITNISLTAGDWDVSAMIDLSINGATWSQGTGGIGTATGNSAAGLTLGTNAATIAFANSSTTPTEFGISVPPYRVSIASNTPYYLKVLSIYSAGNPQAAGRISARRVR